VDTLMITTLSARRRLLAVICGGFLGAIARALLSAQIQAHLGKGWPYDILLINLTGALLLALVTTLADARLLIGPTRRLFINVGFLGAYTTFSSLALGDVQLLTAGHLLAALAYILISMVGGLLAVLAGESLGLWLVVRLKALPAMQLARAPMSQIEEALQQDMEDDLLVGKEEPPAS
jgi:CrcB protein